jgi:phycocyanobilin:ferredoxin oxidoreductase
MSDVWNKLIEIQDSFTRELNNHGHEIVEPEMERFNQPGWINRVWTGHKFRRAHIDIVDARNTKGLWMMHCCIFPHTHNPAPIFGFDVIAGKNKMTGCFIDYSQTGNPDHPMIEYFGEEVSRYEWFKKRELPAWAKRIFSPHMVAAGNVSDESELRQLSSLASILINHYLETVGETNNTAGNTSAAQNYYCENQKQNPHTPKVMASLGLDENNVRIFIDKCLFPEIR